MEIPSSLLDFEFRYQIIGFLTLSPNLPPSRQMARLFSQHRSELLGLSMAPFFFFFNFLSSNPPTNIFNSIYKKHTAYWPSPLLPLRCPLHVYPDRRNTWLPLFLLFIFQTVVRVIFFLKNYLFLILCALVFFLRVCLYEGLGAPGTGVTDSCELPCRC
jgi:hypothetical protein